MNHAPVSAINCLKIVVVCFLLLAGNASAQIGFKTSLVSPDGDIGQYYNKGVSADLFVVLKDDDGPWRERAGIFYTQLSARLDTFPVYAVQTGANAIGTNTGTLVSPGYLVDHSFNMYYVYIDIDYRIVRLKKFSLYADVGLEGGISHVVSDRGYETVLTEQDDDDKKIAGYKIATDLDYQVSKHFEIFFEAAANRMTTTDWSTKYEHNTFGLGANYYFKPLEAHHKRKHLL